VSGVHDPRVFSWRVSYTGEDPTGGGAVQESIDVRAPSASDALVIFALNAPQTARASRYWRGAEAIELVEGNDEAGPR
jgi:hypothetical protein